MEYRHLCGTGIEVSRLSLGTMTFGREVDQAGSFRMIRAALDAGINLVDTADSYSHGVSEEIVGRALRGVRDRVFLATKIGNVVGPGPHDGGLHRGHIIQGVERQLKRLQTDHIDIYYWHLPDRNTPLEEMLEATNRLVEQGKVVYLGMSNHASWRVCEAMWMADRRGWVMPSVVQNPYNLITRSIEEEHVEFLNKMGVGMTVYNPLAGGLLTGKYTGGGEPTAGTRLAEIASYRQRFWHKANLDAVDALQQVAVEAGLSLIELSLRWLLTQPHVDSVIIGASKLAHLEQNIAAASGGRLSDSVLAACDAVWSELRGPQFSYVR